MSLHKVRFLFSYRYYIYLYLIKFWKLCEWDLFCLVALVHTATPTNLSNVQIYLSLLLSCSVAVVHRLSCSATCGIFLGQGMNPCALHWQVDSLPLDYQGSSKQCILNDTDVSRHCWDSAMTVKNWSEYNWKKIYKVVFYLVKYNVLYISFIKLVNPVVQFFDVILNFVSA